MTCSRHNRMFHQNMETGIPKQLTTAVDDPSLPKATKADVSAPAAEIVCIMTVKNAVAQARRC